VCIGYILLYLNRIEISCFVKTFSGKTRDWSLHYNIDKSQEHRRTPSQEHRRTQSQKSNRMAIAEENRRKNVLLMLLIEPSLLVHIRNKRNHTKKTHVYVHYV
jgi:hypothetical protein